MQTKRRTVLPEILETSTIPNLLYTGTAELTFENSYRPIYTSLLHPSFLIEILKSQLPTIPNINNDCELTFENFHHPIHIPVKSLHLSFW